MSNKIKRLIDAASEAGLIKNVKTDGSGKYLGFEMDGRDYELCLNGNPDHASHPRAERALRASDAVIDLFSKIDHSYNCFAVSMSSIEAPTAEGLRSMLKIPRNVKVSEPREQTKKSFSGITHMLEVIIDIFIGNDVNGTVVDRVFAEKVSNRFIFRRAKEDEFSYDADVIRNFDSKKAGDAARKLLGDLGRVDELGRVKKDDNSKKMGMTYKLILKALAEDPDSEFSKFMEGVRARHQTNGAQSNNGGNIGRIEMRFNSLYVGAERVKRFVYTLTPRGEDPVEYVLDWGKPVGVGEARELYVLVDGGEYVGATSIPPMNAEGEIDKTMKIADGDGLIFGYLPRKGKGGVLSLRSGFVPEKKYKSRRRVCPWCLCTYYAELEEHARYREQYPLLDRENHNEYGCEKCCVEGKTVSRGFLDYEYKTNIKTTDGKRRGAMFTRVDKNGITISLENGGNVFSCSNCGDLICHEPHSTNPVVCDLCGGFVCGSCAKAMKSGVYKEKNNNHNPVFCSKCEGAKSVHYKKKELKVYKAYRPDEKEIVYVLDSPTLNEESHLEKCSECDKLIYTDGASVTQRCERCGMYAGDKCYPKNVSSRFGGAHVCKLCNSEMNADKGELDAFMEYVSAKRDDNLEAFRESLIKTYLASKEYLLELKNSFRDKFIMAMGHFGRKSYDQVFFATGIDAWSIVKKGTDASYRVNFLVYVLGGGSIYRFGVDGVVQLSDNDGLDVGMLTGNIKYKGVMYGNCSNAKFGGMYR